MGNNTNKPSAKPESKSRHQQPAVFSDPGHSESKSRHQPPAVFSDPVHTESKSRHQQPAVFSDPGHSESKSRHQPPAVFFDPGHSESNSGHQQPAVFSDPGHSESKSGHQQSAVFSDPGHSESRQLEQNRQGNKEMEAHLRYAAQTGDLSRAQRLLAQGCRVNAEHEHGWTALFYAATYGHLNIVVELCMNHGADVLHRDKYGHNAFHLCAANGHVAIAQYLAPKMGDHLFDGDNDGDTALHRAAISGHLPMVDYLVTICRFDTQSRNKRVDTPLHIALTRSATNSMGRLKVAQFLVQKGAHADDVIRAVNDGDRRTALRLLRKADSEPPSWLPDYEEAVAKQGSVDVTINRNIIIGHAAVGKSSLKNYLVHNKPKEVKISTPVMKRPDVIFISSEKFAVDGTSVWLPLSDEKMASSIRSSCLNHQYHVTVATPAVHSEDGRPKSKQSVKENDGSSVAIKAPSRTSRKEAGPTAGDSLHPTKQSPFHEAHLSLMRDHGVAREEDLQLNGARFIHMLDTGGQPSFQDVLPLLLDMPCTYVHVFNAAQDLDQPVPTTYRPNAFTAVEAMASSETAWEMTQRSLSTVHTLAYKVASNVGKLPMDIDLPPLRIVLVGTFKDQLMKMGMVATATAKISERIELLETKPYYSHIVSTSDGQLFFLVNNLPPDDVSKRTQEDQASIDDLRVVLSHPNGALKTKIPIGWFHFETVARRVAQKFFPFAELLEQAQKLKCISSADPSRELRSLLQFFHSLGVFTFIDRPDVSDTVCTDNSVFLQEVSKLLTIQFAKTPKCIAAKRFKKTGILTLDQGLFSELDLSKEVDPVWLLRCLCHLGVTACLSPPDATTTRYFMPAALPAEVSQESAPGSVAPLLVAFKFKEDAFITTQDLPRGIFTHLAVELANKEGWQVVPEKSTRLAIQFRWKELDISIVECPGHISIVPSVSIHAKCSAAKLHECCSNVRATFEESLQAFAQAVFGSKFTDTADTLFGFSCPCGTPTIHLAVISGDSIVCTLNSKRHKYLQSHQVWFSHVEGAELQPHPSDPSILHLVDHTAGGGGNSSQTTAPVTSRPDHLMLFRRHVSRTAAGKGRAVLEGVGLDSATIAACFTSHPLNEEETVQAGLTMWKDGQGQQPPTWTVLIEAMDYAEIAQEHIRGLKEKLGVSGT